MSIKGSQIGTKKKDCGVCRRETEHALIQVGEKVLEYCSEHQARLIGYMVSGEGSLHSQPMYDCIAKAEVY